MLLISFARQLYHNNAGLSSTIYTQIHLSACRFVCVLIQPSWLIILFHVSPSTYSQVKWPSASIHWDSHTHIFMRLYAHPYSTMLGGYIHIESCDHTPIYIAQPYTPMVIYLYAYIHNVNIYIHTYNHCIYLYTYIPILRGKIKKRNPRTRTGSGKNQAL